MKKVVLTLICILFISISIAKTAFIKEVKSHKSPSDTTKRKKVNLSVSHPISWFYPKFRTQIEFPLKDNKSYLGVTILWTNPWYYSSNVGIEYKRKVDEEIHPYFTMERGYYGNLTSGYYYDLKGYDIYYYASISSGIYVRQYFSKKKLFYFESQLGVKLGHTLRQAPAIDFWVEYLGSPISPVDLRFNFGMQF